MTQKARENGTVEQRSERMSSVVRPTLLVAALSTYLISADDVVWRFIKTAPHARLLEHLAFGIAAAMLGIGLLLKIRADADVSEPDSHDPHLTKAMASNLLQAIGIGLLLPLPGLVVLVCGEFGVSLFLIGRGAAKDGQKAEPDRRLSEGLNWRHAVVKHIGLSCAFISMIVFSILLIDRVADVLFAMTALVSTTASFRKAQRARTNQSQRHMSDQF